MIAPLIIFSSILDLYNMLESRESRKREIKRYEDIKNQALSAKKKVDLLFADYTEEFFEETLAFNKINAEEVFKQRVEEARGKLTSGLAERGLYQSSIKTYMNKRFLRETAEAQAKLETELLTSSNALRRLINEEQQKALKAFATDAPYSPPIRRSYKMPKKILEQIITVKDDPLNNEDLQRDLKNILTISL